MITFRFYLVLVSRAILVLVSGFVSLIFVNDDFSFSFCQRKQPNSQTATYRTTADETLADERHYEPLGACLDAADETGHDAHCGGISGAAGGGSCRSQIRAYQNHQTHCRSRM